ncbi:MAG: hypothetical protein ACE5HK_04325 [Candidatus Methylomirabilales bacterium]
MADTVRKVEYFYIEAADKPGEGARVLKIFQNAGVNLLAFTGFPRGRRAQIDFVPEDSTAFKSAAKQAGLKISPQKTAFLVQGEDRIGAIAEVMARLAAAKINVTAIDAVGAGGSRFGAILWVKSPDVNKAAKALGVS